MEVNGDEGLVDVKIGCVHKVNEVKTLSEGENKIMINL